MNPLVKNEDTELASTIGETTEVAWIAPAEISYEEWQAIGATMQQVNRSLNWWLGDWMNAGEERYGEMYAQAIEITDSSLDSLRKYKAVAGRVRVADRNKNVSWTHHLLVAYLDQAEHKPLLDLAERYELPTRTLKQIVELSDGDRATVVANVATHDLDGREFLAMLERFSTEFVNPITETPASESTPTATQRMVRLAGLRPAEIPPNFDKDDEEDGEDPTPAQPELFDLGPDPFAETIEGEFTEAEIDESYSSVIGAWEEIGLPLAEIGYDVCDWGGIRVQAILDEDGEPALAWTIDLSSWSGDTSTTP